MGLADTSTSRETSRLATAAASTRSEVLADEFDMRLHRLMFRAEQFASDPEISAVRQEKWWAAARHLRLARYPIREMMSAKDRERSSGDRTDEAKTAAGA